MSKPLDRKWALAIFAYRESKEQLINTLGAARRGTNSDTTIDLLINGNSPLANELGKWLETCGEDWARLRVWSIKFGDKANAWNSYFHQIWQGEELVFFSDGYVSLRPDSVQLLGSALLDQPNKLGGSGIPSGSISARQLARTMLSEGGFHGNFCALKGDVINDIKRRSIRIPRGLYRTDSLVGAWLSFGLNPVDRGWDPDRLLVHPNVTWDTPPKHWWRYSDIVAKFRRKLRQARGRLENAAIRYFLATRKWQPESLPSDARQLINNWIANSPQEWRTTSRFDPLARHVLHSLADMTNLDSSEIQPQLIWQRHQIPV